MKVLIHIGFHKTGTSLLQENVFEHGDNGINSIHRKEIYKILIEPHDLTFDSSKAQNQMGQLLVSDKWNIISHERLSGQPHFGSRDSVSIAKRLKSVFPEAKILIGVREQKSMLMSLHNQYIRAFGSLSLETYINNENLRRDINFSKETLRYSELILLYQSLYSKQGVLVVPFEILQLNKSYFLNKLEKFLNKKLVIREGVVNSSKKQSELIFWRILNPFINPNVPHIERIYFNLFFSKLLRFMIKSFSIVTPNWLEEKMISKKKSKIKRIVSNYYLNDNNRLSQIVDIDFHSLGYDCDKIENKHISE